MLASLPRAAYDGRKSVWRRKEVGTDSLILAQEEMHAARPRNVFRGISWIFIASVAFLFDYFHVKRTYLQTNSKATLTLISYCSKMYRLVGADDRHDLNKCIYVYIYIYLFIYYVFCIWYIYIYLCVLCSILLFDEDPVHVPSTLTACAWQSLLFQTGHLSQWRPAEVHFWFVRVAFHLSDFSICAFLHAFHSWVMLIFSILFLPLTYPASGRARGSARGTSPTICRRCILLQGVFWGSMALGSWPWLHGAGTNWPTNLGDASVGCAMLVNISAWFTYGHATLSLRPASHLWPLLVTTLYIPLYYRIYIYIYMYGKDIWYIYIYTYKIFYINRKSKGGKCHDYSFVWLYGHW